jgi:hypothetical protein
MATPAQRMEAERHKYPGMAPREVIIFRAWLALHQNEYDRFDYNVRVGNGTDPGAEYPAIYRQQYIENTQKRIDAVGWKALGNALLATDFATRPITDIAISINQPTIIEVKDRATASCMSQILTYKALWPFTFPNTPAPKLLLVTNRVAADMPLVLDASGITLEIVPADFSSLANTAKPAAP